MANTRPSGTFYRIRIGIGLAAAGALLAACGSSSKAASTGTGTTSTAPSTAPSAASSTSGSGSSSTNLGGGSFCDKAKKASTNVSSAAKGLATDTPDALKSFEQNALNELNALKDQAPAEIKGAVSTVAGAESTLFNDLQAANFDFTKVSSQVATVFSTPQFTQAIGQIDSYLVAKCGINPSALPTS